MRWPHAPRRRMPRPGAIALLAIAAVAVSGCSALGLDDEGPVDATVTTSAAPVATPSTSEHAVQAPSLRTGTTTAASDTPIPWVSQLPTSSAPTTSEAPLTAPTTTRTLTFKTFSSVTSASVAAPTLAATPPPDCYAKGSCPAVSTASSGGGTVAVVNPDGGSDTVAILLTGGKAVDALSVARLASPSVACAGSHCLVQGTKSGLHFGSMMTVSGRHLKAVTGTPVSAGSLRLTGSGSSILVAGSQRFTDYGLLGADAPIGARTWTLSGGALKSTGCSVPRLYASAPKVTSAQSGTCSGTPRIAGYGSASAHKIATLGGFRTPSGNIACAIVSSGTLACTAKQHNFSVATCTKSTRDVPKGLRGLRVLLKPSGGYSHDGCLGYTGTEINAVAKTVSYSRLAVGAGFVCEILESGVTCTAKNGKGFTLSRSSLKRA